MTAHDTPQRAQQTTHSADRCVSVPRAFLSRALAANPLFLRLDSASHREELLSSFSRNRYRRGELVIHYGDKGDRFFVLEQGECAVELPATEVVVAPPQQQQKEEQSTQAAEPTQPLTTTSADPRRGESPAGDAAAASAGAAAIAAAASPAEPVDSFDPLQLESSPQQIVTATVQLDESVRVDLVERGSSFGEVSLLYDTPRSASVRCVSEECVTWSVDAATFRQHAKSGALLLRSIFQQFASVRVKESGKTVARKAATPTKQASSDGAGAPATSAAAVDGADSDAEEAEPPDPEHLLMTLPDFVQAIEHSKGLCLWHESSSKPAAVAASEPVEADADDDEDDDEEEQERAAAARDHHYFRRKLAKLLHAKRKEREKAAALAAANAEAEAAAAEEKKQRLSESNALSQLSSQRLRLIFRLADSSGDNLLSFGEFIVLHSLLSQPHSELQLVFRLLDRDKNGLIERAEFVAAMQALEAERGEQGDSSGGNGSPSPAHNWNTDPLVLELFGPPLRRRRRDVQAALEAEESKRLERTLQEEEEQRQQCRDAATGGSGLFGWARAAYSGTTEWLQNSVFHRQRELVKPTVPVPGDVAAANAGGRNSSSASGDRGTPQPPDDEEEYVLEYRALSYERFSQLLKKRRNNLPPALQAVTADFKAIDKYWRGSDAPFALAGAMESGFGSSLNLNMDTLSQQGQALIPTVTSAHVADSERLLRAVPWKNLLAGGIAGAVSRSIVAPVERLKMLYQMDGGTSSNTTTTSATNGNGKTGNESSLRRYRGGLQSGLRQMYRDDGWRGWFKGNGANIARVVPLIALQFTCYELYRLHLFGRWRDDNSIVQRLVAGASAGMTACLLTYPLDTVRARLTLQRGRQANRMLPLMRQIYRTEGMRGFYYGLVPSLAGVIPYVGLDFAVYETLKHSLPRDEHDECSRLHLFVCGAVAGVVGQTIAYPLDLVRRRMQVYGWAEGTKYTHNYHRGTFVDALRIIRAEDGYRGLFRGIGINYVKVVPAVSVAFMVYERVLEQLGDGS